MNRKITRTQISYLTHLECSRTGKKYDAERLQNLSDEGAPLLARYDLESLRSDLSREGFSGYPGSIWRYRELLPVRNPDFITTLNEGQTPLFEVPNLARRTGFRNLYIKDEAQNPTGSFKARGISAALSAAIERGATAFSIPSAGNAAGALSAYAAKARVGAHVYMPKDTPLSFKLECEYYGAKVKLVDGLISDCGTMARQESEENGYFDISTLKEPYRLEGKKTMGIELAEQMNWKLPDVIVYPTGGGTGLIGMWKAFQELEELGWIDGKKPRMVSVQSEGCAPIVQAFEEGREEAETWKDARTLSSGIRVPSAVGDFMILDILRESGGTAISVTDEETISFCKKMARYSGVFPSPEGGATLAGLVRLRERQLVQPDEKVVLFNTGTGYKYLEALNMEHREPVFEQLTK